MKPLSALVLLSLLAACGADGEPVPPTRAGTAPANGITISGDARIGVVKTF
ncbi:hypothetical protein GCM10011534_23900 [Pseudooceanicola nanhaiensis]|jgi:hypothetical protein|uniref:Argininosuccinate lyase n=1 Tax=Pseudooceanicola nanhaiensis TaxID=375761 RepID=A0A917WF13_9RHOB|nr:argininosuccinate lyase [Pseudooceanicola nanhaiensis]GGM01275.1 hypothetical protein GCM10011534_23900 [Pseudooceanicola nanhaiensis]